MLEASPKLDAPRGSGSGKAPRDLHPFLFAVFPVAYLYAQNVDEVSPGQVWVPLAAVLVLAGALYLAARLLWRQSRKAAVLVSVWLLLLFSYGHVYRALRGGPLGAHRILLPAWTLMGVAALVVLLRTRRDLRGLTRGLNATAAILVAMNVGVAGLYEVRSAAASPDLGPPVRLRPGGNPPDIYYIVLDRYAGAASLRQEFGFDNGPFLGSLASRGFVLPPQTRANYSRTSHSIAATLNMTYLGSLADRARSPGDYGVVYDAVRYHRVGRSLKDAGYRYIHIGSWWEPTRTNPLADESLTVDPLNELSRVLLRHTAIFPISKRLGALGDFFDLRRTQFRRVPYQFEEIAKAGRLAGPTFVFAHFTVPHPPFVFDRAGRYVTRKESRARGKVQAYLDQLVYVNTKVERLVRTLLADPEGRRSIIVVQSDEGPLQANTLGATTEEIQQKFDILNAMYLPGVDPSEFPDDLTPVNTFRLIFSRYLGADLPLLPDRSYLYRDGKHIYEYVDVTAQATRPAEGLA